MSHIATDVAVGAQFPSTSSRDKAYVFASNPMALRSPGSTLNMKMAQFLAHVTWNISD